MAPSQVPERQQIPTVGDSNQVQVVVLFAIPLQVLNEHETVFRVFIS